MLNSFSNDSDDAGYGFDGDMFLGPLLGPSPVSTIVHCLARKENTDEFYNLKVVMMISIVLKYVAIVALIGKMFNLLLQITNVFICLINKYDSEASKSLPKL